MDIKKELLKMMDDGDYHTYSEMKIAMRDMNKDMSGDFDYTLAELIEEREILKITDNLYLRNMVIKSAVHERYMAMLYQLWEIMDAVTIRYIDLFDGMENCKVANALVEIRKIVYKTLKAEGKEPRR